MQTSVKLIPSQHTSSLTKKPHSVPHLSALPTLLILAPHCHTPRCSYWPSSLPRQFNMYHYLFRVTLMDYTEEDKKLLLNDEDIRLGETQTNARLSSTDITSSPVTWKKLLRRTIKSQEALPLFIIKFLSNWSPGITNFEWGLFHSRGLIFLKQDQKIEWN